MRVSPLLPHRQHHASQQHRLRLGAQVEGAVGLAGGWGQAVGVAAIGLGDELAIAATPLDELPQALNPLFLPPMLALLLRTGGVGVRAVRGFG